MSKSDATWLRNCYILFAVLVAFVFNKVIEAVGVEMLWDGRVEYFTHYNNIISIVLGAAVSLLIWKNKERREHHLSVVAEVRKVRWPTKEATKQMTIIVAVVVAIFAVILSCFDFVWLELLKFLT